ncbi:Uncharacterised protein [Vibrio cholerae]|uniref:Uncharacterized protein n=1 Tax=Vibrio cholerae TaxID=666 RepID=A0A655QPT8_VIBCL|nr:Uncharacterised protein [Vibrio cholerae]CSC05493.1 Uncharacterised protein [Vibrio cholerae]CSC11202.1 Uncharacterised protein [Vibrio cholerae]CSC60828.1 Uncharacterised protein [Vibrio cholerae]CSC67303.1 Uncharacterised protein [Vibrio cholerae]
MSPFRAAEDDEFVAASPSPKAHQSAEVDSESLSGNRALVIRHNSLAAVSFAKLADRVWPTSPRFLNLPAAQTALRAPTPRQYQRECCAHETHRKSAHLRHPVPDRFVACAS